MFYLLTTLIVIAAMLLILVVLIQNSKKEGLGNTWSNASASQLMGVQRTGDFLERFTWALVLVIFLLTLATSRFLHEVDGRHLTSSPNLERAKAQIPSPSVKQLTKSKEPSTVPKETPPGDKVPE